jgi:UDP-N-acetylmuramate dehydrogenase
LALNLEDGPASSVTISAGGGLLNTVLLQRLAGQGIAGLGCLAGVPGTVGGAVVMNAGTALGEVSSVLLSVEGADGQRLDRADLAMEYREGGLPPGFIVTAARFRGNRDGFAAERERVASHLARRTATQPLNLPSCGSVFRNPPGAHAGALIERVGLKGWRSGQAQVSDKHANFIVNLGGATSLDVMRCIRQAWSTVRLETGICLIPEVRVLGDWPPELWPLPAA